MKDNSLLQEWLDSHNINYSLRHDVVVIPDFGRCLIQNDYDHIFKLDKQTGDVVFNNAENYEFLKGDDISYIVFPFGKRWYYVDITEELSTQQFHVLRWIGKTPETEVKVDFVPLGIHSGYELLNGSGNVRDWCNKAKWLGYKGIGIADKNTLAATLDLQTSATAKGLPYIFGYSTSVNFGSEKIGIKIYSQTQEGYRNLLRIQKAVAVDNCDNKEIDYIELLNRGKGNVLVCDKLSGAWLASQLENGSDCLDSLIKAFDGWVYFQVDLSEYKANRIDVQVLLSQKAYFDNFYVNFGEYKKDIRPVLIQDVYYLDKEDWKNKIVLNKVDTGAAHEQSDRQYLKTMDEMYDEFNAIFSEKYPDEVFDDMCLSTVDIADGASAAYDLTENYAPRYDMTEAEQKKYGTTLNMFHRLLEEGFKRLVPDGEDAKYRERVEYEKYVLESTDNVDYILITWDELNWAQSQGILTGIGRGSAGGSLVLYLLGITFIDPLKYDLIFERFLLPERGGLAPADVTKICEDVDSDEYIEIAMENGKTYKFDKDAQFLVERDGQNVKVYSDELQVGDDIVWDRRDEIFTLEKEQK